MGLSFHFKGKIKSIKLLKPLIAEVKDICESLGWKYQVREAKTKKQINGKWMPENLSGISVSPSECEPVSLTFLPNGKLCSFVNLLSQDAYEKKKWIYYNSTKTQFAGPDVHIAIVKLLKYLEKKYLDALDVTDEGNYWETMDEKILMKQFAEYNFYFDAVEKDLNKMPAVPGETVDSLARRIGEMFKNLDKPEL